MISAPERPPDGATDQTSAATHPPDAPPHTRSRHASPQGGAPDNGPHPDSTTPHAEPAIHTAARRPQSQPRPDQQHAPATSDRHTPDMTQTPAHGPLRAAYEAQERHYGQTVRQWRIARGWSQEDLARLLAERGFDMHQTTVAKLEKGQRPLRLAEALCLADICGQPCGTVFATPPAQQQILRQQAQQALDTLRRWINSDPPDLPAHTRSEAGQCVAGRGEISHLQQSGPHAANSWAK